MRQFQSAWPRLLGLVPKAGGASTAIEDVFAKSISIEIPSAPFSWTNRTRTFTSAALSENTRYGEENDQPPEVISFIDDTNFDNTVLTLPTDLDEVGKINPDLRYVMEAHASFLSQNTLTPREQIESLLQESNQGKSVKITKTSLLRLRVDQLRSQLDSFGADTRGNKSVLVQRLLDAVSSSDANKITTDIVQSLGIEGVVSSKQIERAARIKAKQRLTRADVTISETQLRELQHDAISAASQFSRIFDSPHEIARLLSDARADDIAVIDVREKCTFTDYMVLATGRSSQMVHLLAQSVLHEVKQRCGEVAPGVMPGIEGADDPNADWLVVDSGSIVVHIFQENARKEFDLEGLWGEEGTITRVAQKKSLHTLQSIQIED